MLCFNGLSLLFITWHQHSCLSSDALPCKTMCLGACFAFCATHQMDGPYLLDCL